MKKFRILEEHCSGRVYFTPQVKEWFWWINISSCENSIGLAFNQIKFYKKALKQKSEEKKTIIHKVN